MRRTALLAGLAMAGGIRAGAPARVAEPTFPACTASYRLVTPTAARVDVRSDVAGMMYVDGQLAGLTSLDGEGFFNEPRLRRTTAYQVVVQRIAETARCEVTILGTAIPKPPGPQPLQKIAVKVTVPAMAPASWKSSRPPSDW